MGTWEPQWKSRKHQFRTEGLVSLSAEKAQHSYSIVLVPGGEFCLEPLQCSAGQFSPLRCKFLPSSFLSSWNPGLALCVLCSSSTLGSAFLSASLSHLWDLGLLQKWTIFHLYKIKVQFCMMCQKSDDIWQFQYFDFTPSPILNCICQGKGKVCSYREHCLWDRMVLIMLLCKFMCFFPALSSEGKESASFWIWLKKKEKESIRY